MKKPARKKPARKKPTAPKKNQPAAAKTQAAKKRHHLTAAQLQARRASRIKTLRHQLHLARHPALPPKKAAKARKPRGLPIGEAVACCSAQAVAASLELSGHGPVSDSAVLALHEHAGGSADAAVTIWAALMAACVHGLDGARPAGISAVGLRGRRMFSAGTIIGLELPGAHAVTVAPDGCWLSWGERCDPARWPDAVIEEAWAVTW